MLHGNIYPAEKIPNALASFFRQQNLVALRELALRFVADETEEDLMEYLVARHPEVVWDTAERIMVAVTGASGTDGVLRRAARMALRVHGDLQVVHVVGDESSRPATKHALASIKQLAEDLGATWHEVVADDPAPALVNFAKENQITQIVLGASKRSRWERVVSRASVVQRVLRFAGQSGVDVHVIARVDEHLAPFGTAADLARSIASEDAPAEGEAAPAEGEPAPAKSEPSLVDEFSELGDE
jgi:two-component system sensor histidine kinase KdpD